MPKIIVNHTSLKHFFAKNFPFFRCNLNEIGHVLNNTGVGGDGGTAAVIVRDGVNVGIIYIR